MKKGTNCLQCEKQSINKMKAIRKDVILDYDQLESTLLEKDILLKAHHPFLVGMVQNCATLIKVTVRFTQCGASRARVGRG